MWFLIIRILSIISEAKAKAKRHYRDVYHITLPTDDVSDEVFVLITDFENDKYLDDFAKLMRAVLDRVGDRLRVITIGGEKLANLKTNMGIHSYFNYFEQHFI